MPKNHKMDNPDIIPLAVYELGGVGQFIDVEDIFIRCWEIAPERFGWRKHKLPNYKNLYHALQHFEAQNPEILLKTPDGLGRQLSAEGVKWVRDRAPLLRKFIERPVANPPTRRPVQRQLNELAEHPLSRAFMNGALGQLQKHEVADLLVCSPDSPPAVWRERLETYRSAATESKREDLVRILEHIRNERPEWFELKSSDSRR
jgi:hypothetical protein